MFERENNEVNNAITILQNIDLDTIASIFRFAVIYYASRKVTQGVALQIEYHFPKCKKIKMPPELVLESGDFQVDDKIKAEDKAHILNFINTVCSNFSDDCLILLCNNLKSLKLKDTYHQKHIFNPDVTGAYNLKKNAIIIRDCSLYNPIYHELFHLSSSIIQDKTTFSGFSQDAFGKGLNEGYTQLLTERYFAKESVIDSSYPIQKRIVQVLEIIVGKDEMEQLYMQANLKGLVDFLSKYATEKEILSFISNVDFTMQYLPNHKFLLFKKYLLRKAFSSISDFLIKIFIKYFASLAIDSNVDEEELHYKFMLFLSLLSISINISGEEYVLLNEDTYYNILHSILDNNFKTNKIK